MLGNYPPVSLQNFKDNIRNPKGRESTEKKVAVEKKKCGSTEKGGSDVRGKKKREEIVGMCGVWFCVGKMLH